jgi:MOSC domain-containing protein YiiM
VRVVGVHLDAAHRFSKPPVEQITLRTGHGVEGDAHFGVTVQHRSRVKRDPTAPNLRQVHLFAAELLDTLVVQGFRVRPGAVGENVTTRGIDLLGLSVGTVLRLGADALIEITGLRNPCFQLDGYQAGLMRAVLDRDPDGQVIRKAGVMAIVLHDGIVRAGDAIEATPPPGEHRPLLPV